MGDEIHISGNFDHVVLNVKSTLTNVQQTVGAMSTGDEAARQELQRLIGQLSQTLEQVPASLKEQAEAVAASVQVLVESAKTEKPNKTMLQITGQGLKKAAANLAEAAPAVVGIASQVVAAVLRMQGLP